MQLGEEYGLARPLERGAQLLWAEGLQEERLHEAAREGPHRHEVVRERRALERQRARRLGRRRPHGRLGEGPLASFLWRASSSLASCSALASRSLAPLGPFLIALACGACTWRLQRGGGAGRGAAAARSRAPYAAPPPALPLYRARRLLLARLLLLLVLRLLPLRLLLELLLLAGLLLLLLQLGAEPRLPLLLGQPAPALGARVAREAQVLHHLDARGEGLAFGRHVGVVHAGGARTLPAAARPPVAELGAGLLPAPVDERLLGGRLALGAALRPRLLLRLGLARRLGPGLGPLALLLGAHIRRPVASPPPRTPPAPRAAAGSTARGARGAARPGATWRRPRRRGAARST